jgi:hypothetical protein
LILFCHTQGERKGQENLKTDLVRRIKMLEYALKQERAKYAKVGRLHLLLNQDLRKQKLPTQKWRNVMFEAGFGSLFIDSRSGSGILG